MEKKVSVIVESSGLYEITEKANQLVKLLREAKQIINSLSSEDELES